MFNKLSKSTLLVFLLSLSLAMPAPVFAQQAAAPVQDPVAEFPGKNASVVGQLESDTGVLAFGSNPYNVSIPEKFGTIEEVFQASGSAPLVVHIQNAHANYEAQVNIKNILNHLVEHYQFSLIQLEGAASKIDPSVLQPSYLKEANLKLVDFLMRDGRITGADAFAVETDKPVNLYGIEDPSLYAENLSMFKKIYQHQDELKRFFDEIHRLILDIGPKLLTPELLDITRKAEEFSTDKIDLLDYVIYLSQVSERHQFISLDQISEMATYPNLVRLMRLYRLEEKLNQSGLKKETEALKVELKSKKPDSKELDEILSKLDGPAKGIKPRSYFIELTKLGEKAKVNFLNYPAVKIFAEFLIHQDEIEHQSLFSEIKTFETFIQTKLFTSDDEKSFLELISSSALLEQYFRLELSREKIALYLEHPDKVKPSWIFNEANRLAGNLRIRSGSDQNFQKLDDYMQEVERFYQLVLKRDQFFTEQVTSRMKSVGEDKTILITGGFHKDGLLDFFRKQNISYVVVNPKIDIKQGNENYLKVMLEENNAVGSVFAGSFAVEVSHITNPANRPFLGKLYDLAVLITARLLPELPGDFSERINNRFTDLAERAQVAFQLTSLIPAGLGYESRAEVRFIDAQGQQVHHEILGRVDGENRFSIKDVPAAVGSKDFPKILTPPEALNPVSFNELPPLASAASQQYRSNIPVTSAFTSQPQAQVVLGSVIPQAIVLPDDQETLDRINQLSSVQEAALGGALYRGASFQAALEEASVSSVQVQAINDEHIMQLSLPKTRQERVSFFSSTRNPARAGILVIPILDADRAQTQLLSLQDAVKDKGTAAVVYGRNLKSLAQSLGIVTPRIQIVDFPAGVTDDVILERMVSNIQSGKEIFKVYQMIASELKKEARSPIELNKTGYVRAIIPEEKPQYATRLAEIPGAFIPVMNSALNRAGVVRGGFSEAFATMEVELLRRIPGNKAEAEEFPALLRQYQLSGMVVGKGNQWSVAAGVEALVGELFTDFMAAVKLAVAA